MLIGEWNESNINDVNYWGRLREAIMPDIGYIDRRSRIQRLHLTGCRTY